MRLTPLLLLGFLAAAAATKPNIVFLLADDWGWNDVGYHNPDVVTPAIDELVKTGVELDQNYVTAWCTPSRAALLTGMEPIHLGRQSGVLKFNGLVGLTLEQKLFPEYLKDMGYRTHIIGKWHLGHCNRAYLPTSRGFDTQFGFYNSHISNMYKTYSSYPFPYDFHKNDQPLFDRKYGFQNQGDLYRERLIEILNDEASQTDGNPFYLFLSLPHVHWPVMADLNYTDLYPDVDDVYNRRKYLGMVSQMDFIVHTMVELLKENGQYENTIIVGSSDNGGYTSLWSYVPYWGGADNTPLRGEKGEYYEGGTRVNAFVHSPLLTQSGYKSNKKVFVTDWVPTLLHAAGMAEEEINTLGLDGVDQYDTLFNNGPEARSNFIYNIWADANGNNVGAIRSGPFKLLNFDSSMQYQDNFELYNLEEDPTESTDLAPDNASLVDELKIMFNELASTMIPEQTGDEVEHWDAVNKYGFQRTDFCDTEGNAVNIS